MLLFFFLVSIVLSIPGVQTRLAKTLTNKINESFQTDIIIKRVDLSLLGSVQLKGVEIKDHHKDTLLYVKKLRTSILNARKVMKGDVNLGSVSLDGVRFNLKTYKDELDDNLTSFVSKFDTDTPRDSLSKPFMLQTSNIYISDLSFVLSDENNANPIALSLINGGGSLSDFKIEGPNVYTNIRGLYFLDHRNLEVTNLTTDFSYTTKNMMFKNTVLETPTSFLNAEIQFLYNREDLQYFNDKVAIAATFTKSSLSTVDLNKLYDQIQGDNVLNFSATMKGNLNNFKLDTLHITSGNGMRIKADLTLKNVINPEKGFEFEGKLRQVTTDHDELTALLPNILGKNLPSQLKRLGKFNLRGITNIKNENLSVNIGLYSWLGNVKTDFTLKDFSESNKSTYVGEISLEDFNLGVFVNEPLIGKVTFGGNVSGDGFTLATINSGIIGLAKKFEFNEYTYQNLNINGLFQNKLFNGNLFVNDTNLKMKFSGLADFSSKQNKFDFTADVEDVDLHKTNIFKRDSVSKLKGKVEIDVVGNSFETMTGRTVFSNITYTNQKKSYVFDRTVIRSRKIDSIKRININQFSTSEKIAKGYIEGKFSFSELEPIVKNALGSIYTNYKPLKVDPNQFVEFNINLYSEIVDVFFPQIFVANNTNLRGSINAQTNAFKFTFTSPKITGYNNEIDSLYIKLDNKNKLYNTHVTAAKINTDYYDVKKLNLINRTKNDTLFFKSEFKGDVGNDDTFNMDFYYTINEEKKSVLGIEKSTFVFEENIWGINPTGNKDSKVVFDFEKQEYEFNPFHLKSEKKEVTFSGMLRDSTYKDLKIDFKDVTLASFLPPIDSLDLKGVLNGRLDFLQTDGRYSPKGDLSIDNFKINSFEQGDLKLDIVGKDSYEKFDVEMTLKNVGRNSVFAKGVIDFSSERPKLDLKLALNKFKLNAFSPLGQDILSKIRGEASSNVNDSIKVTGFLRNPIMEGELELRNAGMKFPYLNVDYDFEGVTKIRLDAQSFNFEQLTLFDVKRKTRGDFSGKISHSNFNLWSLDLNINTNNLLVLDTQETDESLYYGTGFISGNAQIKGPTDNLRIDINATTNPGTKFVIPLSDVKTVDNYKSIRFDRVKDEVITQENNDEIILESIKGLELNMNLEVTKDATAEVVIDTETGSSLQGSGTGNLAFEINTSGRFIMNGDFIVDKGKYDFKYGSGLINKTFNVQKGGTISWNGSPNNADLNIVAIYSTKANPAKLLENFNSSRKIPVNLITRISGGLFNSKQEFDIQLPNVNPAIKSELEFKINDNDINGKTFQFLSLLTTNSFFNPDKTEFNSSTAIIGTTSSAIMGVLSNLISTNDGKVQFGVDYDLVDKSDVNNLQTDDLVNVSVATQIADRVIVNGKVGVPVGAKTQSSVVGEVKIEVLLNKKGNFRGVVFNRQNEIQYSNEEEGYTQGAGLTYQVNFNTLSELLQKIGWKKKRNRKKNIKEKDTIFANRSNNRITFDAKRNEKRNE